jgi:hypothetical protein
MAYRSGIAFLVEKLLRLVIGRPSAVAADIPAGDPRVGFGSKCDAVWDHAVLSPLNVAVALMQIRNYPSCTPAFGSAYAPKAETERAAVELADARRPSRGDRYSSIARLKALGYFGVPKIRALYEATYFAALRKAGMPEE